MKKIDSTHPVQTEHAEKTQATTADEAVKAPVSTESADQTTEDDSIAARRKAIDKKVADMPTEYGGRPKDKGLEPTRYNDWEFKGRCIDF